MMPARRCWTRRSTVAALGLPLALVSGSLAATAQAQTPPPTSAAAVAAAPSPCPAAMPVATVRTGMTGQGLTVVRGKTPQPFTVEVLGVLKDGIAPGRDLILIEASDLAGRHVVDQGGGIWAGMSGSPVYVGGQLLGAVSYGFTYAPSPIGGLTPAADMMKVLTSAGSSAPPQREPAVVALSKAAKTQLAARAQTATPRGSLQRLTVPLSVSGLSTERLSRLQSQAESAGMPVVAYAGGSKAAPGAKAAMATPVPGGNFAAALSYGDVSSAAVGTTTAVCGHRALAFGHPFYFAGASTYGANDATSLAIVKDNTFGSFKFATIDRAFGRVDQDRLPGIGARLGVVPSTTPINVTIHNLDTGRARTGTTRVTDQHVLPGLTTYAVLSSYDSTFDEIGDGRATSAWTITGTRAGGQPFALTRSNRWADRRDVAFPPSLDVANAVDALVNNEFEPVKVKRVDFDSTVATTFRALRITKVAVSTDGGKKFVTADSLRVKAGAALLVRVTMLPYRSSTPRTVTLTVRVPSKTGGRSGALVVTGGQSLLDFGDEGDFSCLLSEGGCDSQEAQSLNGLMASITSAPRNDDVVATLALEPSRSSSKPLVRTGKARQSAVVSGTREFSVDVRR